VLNPRSARRNPGGPELERPLFWRGQRLESRDLNDVGAGQDERQWWHNRAVHDAYGVVAGLAVGPDTKAPPSLRVQPGLAYDGYGRELVLLETTRVAPPATAGRKPVGAWVLLLRARAEDAAGCRCAGVLGPPRAELVWQRAARAGVADGVPLARGSWGRDGGELFFRRDEDFRPLRARPFARPRVGRGETPPGATAWRPWTEIVAPVGTSARLMTTARGIEVTIDTSAAGFTRTPCYFAWLQGGLWQLAHRLALTVPLPRITREGRDELTFSLWDPTAQGTTLLSRAASDTGAAALARLLSLARQRLYVCWLGIEADRSPFHVIPPALGERRPVTEPR
jgi:hypothetical protein